MSAQAIWHSICVYQGVVPARAASFAQLVAVPDHTLPAASPSDSFSVMTQPYIYPRAAGSVISCVRALRKRRSTLVRPQSICSRTDYKQLYTTALARKEKWESGTYQEITLPGHMHNVESLQFVKSSVLGEVLVSASWDHEVRVWCCATHRCIRRLVGHAAWITCMVVGNGWVVSGALDRTICVWQFEVHAACNPWTILQHPASVTACCWICQGRDLIASGCSSGAMYIWNVQSGQRLHTMEPAHDSVWALRSLAWASGGGARTCFMLAAASRDKLGRVFSGVFTTDSTVITESHSSRPSGLLVHVLRGHSMALLCMDLTWLQADGTASVWDPLSGRRVAMLQGQHKVGVLSLQFCQVGGVVDRHAHPLIAHGAKEGAPKQQLLLISGGADHSVCLWDVMSSSCLHRLTCHAAPVTCVRTMGDVIVTVAEGDCGMVFTVGQGQPGKRHARRARGGGGDKGLQMALKYSVHRASTFSVSSAVALTSDTVAMGGQCGDIIKLNFE